MPRLLAIDYGQVRTGIAVSDELQIIATGLCAISSSEVVDYLVKYCKANTVEAIVLGFPIDMRGKESDNAYRVKGFVKALKQTITDIPIYKEDERMTSLIAQDTIIASGINKKSRRDKSKVDYISAILILQSFMNTPKQNRKIF